MNPADPWAWIGLAGDLIDVAVPFVGGLGEATRAANAALNVTEALDDVHDASKVIDDLAEATIKCDGLCFVAGTKVIAEDGTKNIECVQTGDLVWAWDEQTGKIELKRVVETYVSETYEIVYLFIEGEVIITTPSHPFYTNANGWTIAVDLCAGDVLNLRNGSTTTIQNVKYTRLINPITVFNFQVEDYHTYFVGKNGILVHNQCLLDDVLDDAIDTTTQKGITRNFEKLGGYEQAYSDFMHLEPSNVVHLKTQYGDGLKGILPGGSNAILRPGSRTGGITLEIQISSRKRIKIRY